MTARRARKLEGKKRNFQEDLKKIRTEAIDIFESEQAKKRRHHIQHGQTSVHKHCVEVARRSIRLNRALKLKAVERDLIRGAMLHDYFLYDWHIQKRVHGEYLHGFTHPKAGLKNAEEEYTLTDRERDIIERHMWPMTIHKVPKCRESWIVVAVDKYTAIIEMFNRRWKAS